MKCTNANCIRTNRRRILPCESSNFMRVTHGPEWEVVDDMLLFTVGSTALHINWLDLARIARVSTFGDFSRFKFCSAGAAMLGVI